MTPSRSTTPFRGPAVREAHADSGGAARQGESIRLNGEPTR